VHCPLGLRFAVVEWVSTSLAAHNASVSLAAQMVMDTLSCIGLCGLLLMMKSLRSSGAIDQAALKVGEAIQLLSKVLPGQSVRVMSSGNTFEMEGHDMLERFSSSPREMLEVLKINGRPSSELLASSILHGRYPKTRCCLFSLPCTFVSSLHAC
jgi:hypothetical protein